MKQFRDTSYYISQDGNVYSDKPSGLKKLKLQIDKDGYYQIGLNHNRKRIFYRVHRLVAECYIDNPNNLPIVEHKDDIKTNNHVSNLMWSTIKENTKNAYKNGLCKTGENHHKSKLTQEQVKWIKKNYIAKHPEFNSVELGKKFGIGHHQILKIVKNKNWNYA